MSRIIVITTEPLPLVGWPTTGAGLRAWGLAQGLRSRGHDVRLLMPDDALMGFTPPPDSDPPTPQLPDWIDTFERSKLNVDPRLNECDVVVLQHWGVAQYLGELAVPLAIDLAGPHLLERKLWGSPSFEADLLEKLAALRRADFLTASGADQRLYFFPYLSMAGWDIAHAEDPLPVIPFSLKAVPEPSPVRSDRFIYGGFFLPWQDPTVALDILLEEMDAAGKGELVFIGGAHPHSDVSRGTFDTLLERLKQHPRVNVFGPMSYDDYLGLLRDGGVALDLMSRNAERELAFTTRTVQYLACGLPVIHDNYSELGHIIEATGTGWTFCSSEMASMSEYRILLQGLLEGRVNPMREAENALRLVEDELDWDKTIEPLNHFCRAPWFRENKTAHQLAFESRDRLLQKTQQELERTRSQLDTLLGKRWVRWGLKVLSTRNLKMLPAAFFASVVGAVLVPVFLINDQLGKLGAGRQRSIKIKRTE